MNHVSSHKVEEASILQTPHNIEEPKLGESHQARITCNENESSTDLGESDNMRENREDINDIHNSEENVREDSPVQDVQNVDVKAVKDTDEVESLSLIHI